MEKLDKLRGLKDSNPTIYLVVIAAFLFVSLISAAIPIAMIVIGKTQIFIFIRANMFFKFYFFYFKILTRCQQSGQLSDSTLHTYLLNC
jgi:hypothetical protein